MQKAFTLYWGIGLILMPLYIRYNPFNDVRVCKNYLLVLLAAISCVVFGIKPKTKIAFPIAALLLLSFFNYHDFYNGAALEQTVLFTAGSLLLVQFSSRDRWICKPTISLFMVMVGIITSLFFILNKLEFNPYNAATAIAYPVGPLGQATLSGALLASVMPFAFSFGLIYVWAFMLLGVVIAKSAMTCAAVGISTLFMLIYRIHGRAMAMITSSVIVIVAGLAAFSGKATYDTALSTNYRQNAWEWAYDQIASGSLGRFLFGHGFGYVFTNCPVMVFGQRFTYLHNEALEALLTFGVIGFSIVVYLAIMPFRKKLSSEQVPFLGSLVAVYVNCLGNFTMHVSSIALVALISYAITIKGEFHHGYNSNS